MLWPDQFGRLLQMAILTGVLGLEATGGADTVHPAQHLVFCRRHQEVLATLGHDVEDVGILEFALGLERQALVYLLTFSKVDGSFELGAGVVLEVLEQDLTFDAAQLEVTFAPSL